MLRNYLCLITTILIVNPCLLCSDASATGVEENQQQHHSRHLRSLQQANISFTSSYLNNNAATVDVADVADGCAYYIDDIDSYEPSTQNNQMPDFMCEPVNGLQYNPESSKKCCSYDARQKILDGDGGGFRVQYNVILERGRPAPSLADATCYAYVDALEDTLCSRHQGAFIKQDKFRICQDSCEAVYQKCILESNVISSSFASDGVSFCQNAWNDPCDEFPHGYPCQAGLGIQVATDSCIRMDIPTNELIQYSYTQYSSEVDICAITVKVDWLWGWHGLILSCIILCMVLQISASSKIPCFSQFLIVFLCIVLLVVLYHLKKYHSS